MNGECVIWGSKFPADSTRDAQDFMTFVEYSSRAGGNYKVSFDVEDQVRRLNDEEKARLSTWLIDQNAQGAWLPEITREIVERAKDRQPLPVYERADRLLRWIARDSGTVGTSYITRQEQAEAYAWSESTTRIEIVFLMDYLTHKDWIRAPKGIAYSTIESYQVPARVIVTVEGYSQISSQVVGVDSSQGFVAMWFDGSMKEVRVKGIMPGIEDAGYKPYLVDDDKLADKIDDKIISEIRNSKFLVADFTHGPKGARGGVYFEAGFALGFGIPVIFCCRADQIDDVHFDTRQYNHILWTTPEELRTRLADRIGARLGTGPGTLLDS